MSTKNKLETASVLAFERNFDISDAIFTQPSRENNNVFIPVKIVTKSVRGTISNRLKNATANDPAKLDAKIEKANLQTVDIAMLDSDQDTLTVEWSCKVLPFSGKPSTCNNIDYQAKLIETFNGYIAEHGLSELAKRYAINILNGRWLWRNRMSAESIKIEVNYQQNGESHTIVVDNAKTYSLNSFDINNEPVTQLAALIEAGLSGKQFVVFTIKAVLKMGLGQEVYPSQELVLETGKTKSKVLYSRNEHAAMHSQKISNAIRTIDTWYDEQAEFPIAVEPYGAVTTMGHAFRQPKQKSDFYTLLDNWILKDEKPSKAQQHYIVAVLIRGGVFGASGKE